MVFLHLHHMKGEEYEDSPVLNKVFRLCNCEEDCSVCPVKASCTNYSPGSKGQHQVFSELCEKRTP